MEIYHRKLLSLPEKIHQNPCPNDDCHFYFYNDYLPHPPPPPPQFAGDEGNLNLSICFHVFFICLVAGSFGLILYCTFIRKYCLKRTSPPSLDQTNEDFTNESHAPEMAFHPIWYINNMGLQQSEIDSIAIFKYKIDGKLIEGTECSVCLSEFKEDESLRLLPECSHAFHIPCIDTWLRSHKNCPICRASVILGTNNIVHLNAMEMEENSGENSSYLANEVGDERVGTSETRVGHENIAAMAFPNEQENGSEISCKSCNVNKKNCDDSVVGDMEDGSGKNTEELPQVRRSFSMGSSSASMKHFEEPNVCQKEYEACLKKMDQKRVAKQVNRKSNSRKYRVSKSCSFGSSLHNKVHG